MANYVDNSQINLTVNARQANLVFDQLRKHADELRRKIDQAAKAGDKLSARKFEKELQQTLKTIAQGTTESLKAEQALRSLDRISLKELRKTLRTLNNDISRLQRGSKEWNDKAAQIRKVRKAINDLNEDINGHISRWSKLNARINEWQTAALGAVAALSGVIMAGKSAVQKFAEMEQEMANVRKFTGMTADEVERLNEELRKIDTRSSRIELNKLAQEAGRLGKSSQEDIVGFVRAADKINVALDDLGSGATLTLSKLTGIFGDEERYGTEQSLLKVGSVINELSQNCSASAPYIANFTERLGGVGAQAGMTIQQIMAFAAVLDSNSQKVEASSTALSQVIVRLYQDPAKYARVAGLEVESFARLIREDANAALLLFLETLNKAGGMDVLSPMFKDMGENGSRAIAALSTLAKNIDAVKAQQQEANRAFEEGISIDQEFAVQNNTVQASMEKARNSLNEIAVDLGQKLQPILSHVYSSSSVMLRLLSSSVDFLKRNSGEIASVTAAIVAYRLESYRAAIQTKALAAASAISAAAAKAKGVAMMALTGNIRGAAQAMKAMGAAMVSTPWGLVAAGVAAIAVAVVNLRRKSDEYAVSAKKIVKAAGDISEETLREQREIDRLVGKLKGAESGSKDYRESKQKIIDQYGKYLSGLIDERGEIIDLSKAYDTLSEAVARSARERALSKAKENLETSFAETASSDLSKLQTALENYGASTMKAAELSQKVAQVVVAGKAVPAQVAAEIRTIAGGLPVADSEGKRYSNSAKRRFAKWGAAFKAPDNPAELLGHLERAVSSYEKSVSSIGKLQEETNSSRRFSDGILRQTILDLDKVIRGEAGNVSVPGVFVEKAPVMPRKDDGGKTAASLPQSSFSLSGKTFSGSLVPDMPRFAKPKEWESMDLSPEMAAKIRERVAHELNLRGVELYAPEKSSGAGPETSTTTTEEKQSVLDRRFREELRKVEAEREDAVEKATAENAAGLTDWLQFLEAKHQAEMKFYDDSEAVYQKWNRSQEEGCRQLLRKRAEEERAWNERSAAVSIEDVKRRQRIEETMIRQEFAEKGKLSVDEQNELENRLFDVKVKALQREIELTNKGSKDYAAKREELEQILADNRLRIQQNLAKEVARLEAEYLKLSPAEKLRTELKAIDDLFNAGKISDSQRDSFSAKARDKYAPGDRRKSETGSARENFSQQKDSLDQMLADGSISLEEYNGRIRTIQDELNRSVMAGIKECGSEWVAQLTTMYTAWADFAEALKDPDADPFASLSDGIRSVAAVMGAVMQSMSQLTNAQVEIQTQAIERRYQKEAAFAEGNSYLQAKLEKKKEKEIAKLKSDASKKNFAMQVAMTVASTAANAVSAYGAALQVGGLAGLVLAPVAAGLALAQGAVQIAVLRKQQQAADASGYSEGGFTRKGRKDEPAGIVHAGEWVASQKLVNNPRTRPVIDMLEYAQRNNTVASLSMEDVSRSIAAPMALAYSAPQPQVVVVESSPKEKSEGSPELAQAISRLNDRLDEPFITHNSIEGPHGIRQAYDEYDLLIRNKSK